MNPTLSRPAVLAGLFLLFVAMLASRDPGVLLRAELWAEDGWAWYPEAYGYGWPSLAAPVAGYLQTVSRIVAMLSLALPFPWAPTVFNVCALAIQALPPLFLASSRMQAAWPHAPSRLAFAVLWIVLPNTREVFANLTNMQWHMAVLAFLVLLATVPRGWPGRVVDTAVLVLSGLSGPFCVLLSPVALAVAVMRRDRTSLYRAAIVLATAAVQAAFVLRTIGERTPAPLGAGPRLLARIVSQQVLLAPFIGQAKMTELQGWWLWQNNVAPVAILLLAAGLAAVALWRGPAILRLACLFAGLLLAAALARPQITSEGAQWTFMVIPGAGQRYYYIPMLAWLGVLFALMARRAIGLRVVGGVLVAATAIGIRADWSHPPRQDTGFVARARAFDAAPPGTRMSFPINPAMETIPMVLQKR